MSRVKTGGAPADSSLMVDEVVEATGRAGLRWVAAAVLVLAVLTPTAGAQASATPVQDAEARAQRARAEVDALVDDYTEAEAAVTAGLLRLSKAFALADSAGLDADRLAFISRAAADRRTQDIRAVYASGGATGLTATLLDARSPTELLWRQSTNSRLLERVLSAAELTLHSAQADSRLAERRAADAEVAADEQVAAMNELKAQAGAAQAALVRARRVLAGLDRQARRARQAREAERQIAQAQREARAGRRTATGTVTALGIPADYELAYRTAAKTCPGLRWTLLAAVGQVESGHGVNVGPSSAGALGPMQFMPQTFAAYGVDGDHDGVTDVWDPQDAIFSAANYLCASGRRGGTRESAAGNVNDRAALFAYNRADWYVDLVLSTEQAILARSAELGGS